MSKYVKKYLELLNKELSYNSLLFDFIKKHRIMKVEGDETLKQEAKLLLNALYGEFAYADTDNIYYNLIPIDPECYKLSVQDFIEVVEDAKTHGITVLYLDGKLYYTYNN